MTSDLNGIELCINNIYLVHENMLGVYLCQNVQNARSSVFPKCLLQCPQTAGIFIVIETVYLNRKCALNIIDQFFNGVLPLKFPDCTKRQRTGSLT